MALVITFSDKKIADEITKEIGVTPFGAVIMWAGNPAPDFGFDAEVNIIPYVEGVDGRCAIIHSFDDLDSDWLEAYLDILVKSGAVAISEFLPKDWQYPKEI